MSGYALGVDVGATKVAIATVGDDFKVRQKIEVSTKCGDGSELWANIAEAATRFMSTETGALKGIGVASAGPLDVVKGTLSPVNIPVWRDFPIIDCFKEISKGTPVVLHGDAMALAHAEQKLGAGQGLKNMLGMVVSTGVGGGLILNDQVFTGESGNAYFLGHASVNFEGPICACGRRGCVEAYASGPRMVAQAQARGWKSTDTSFIALVEDAKKGDALALSAIDDGTKALAVGIINALGSLDISHVVIGGGVTESGEIFWGPLREHVKKEASFIGFLREIHLHKAALVRDAGVLGAALAVLG
ncbi:MAG: ROK family protein [Candidatus Planktophila sp.]|jgi:glucokinase|nr:ROK family protein [Candidatus Planktophila sp.]